MADQVVRKRILLVDDEVGIRLTLPRILAKYGFDVTSVANVEDALAEIKAEKFDVLLSDLNIPPANDGFAVIDAMRRHQPRCVNFAFTGYPDEAKVVDALDHDVAHFFMKPVDIEELVSMIRKNVMTNK